MYIFIKPCCSIEKYNWFVSNMNKYKGKVLEVISDDSYKDRGFTCKIKDGFNTWFFNKKGYIPLNSKKKIKEFIDRFGEYKQ